MKRSFIFTVLIVLVIGATIIAMGALAYNAGLTLGIAQSAELQGSGFATPLGPAGMPYGHPFFGFGGFILLTCFLPLVLLSLFFFVFRGLFWHGRWGPHHGGPGAWGMPPHADRGEWRRGPPPIFEQWHRKFHEGEPSAEAEE